MPVAARRFLRKMRGGAQSHLIEADDGFHYVVKFVNNPQHRRILVNELIAAELLRFLRISAPPWDLVRITPEFLEANPDVHFNLGARRTPVEPGRHFGSRYPGNPDHVAVYDFVPDSLLEQVVNRHEFWGMLAFDKWMGNADGRQCVFFRARVHQEGVAKPGFVSWMIDHGFVFDGPNWTFRDSPLSGLYPRRMVYDGAPDCTAWLERIASLDETVIDGARKRIPPEWIEGEEDELDALLERLLRRRKEAPRLVAAALSAIGQRRN